MKTFTLTQEEDELVACYRILSEEGRSCVRLLLATARALPSGANAGANAKVINIQDYREKTLTPV